MSTYERRGEDPRVALGLVSEDDPEILLNQAHAELRKRLPRNMSFEQFLSQLQALVRAKRVEEAVATYARYPNKAKVPSKKRPLQSERATDDAIFENAVRTALSNYLDAVRGPLYRNRSLGPHVNKEEHARGARTSSRSSRLKATEAIRSEQFMSALMQSGLDEIESRTKVIEMLTAELVRSQLTAPAGTVLAESEPYIAKVWCRNLLNGVQELVVALGPLVNARSADELSTHDAALLAAFMKATKGFYTSKSWKADFALMPELKPYEHLLYKLLPAMSREVDAIQRKQNGEKRRSRGAPRP